MFFFRFLTFLFLFHKKGEAYTLDADNFAIVQSGEILCQRIENSLDIKDTKETTDSEFKSVSEKVLKRGAWIGIGSKVRD